MLMEPHDLAVASEQLHLKSNWHGPSLEVAGDGVMPPPDTHPWKERLSLPLVCCSYGLVVSPQGIPEASAAEVYCAVLVKTVVGRQRQWQYLLWHHVQCQHSSSFGLNSIKTEGHFPQAPKTHWLLFIQHNFNGSVGRETRLSFPFPVILQLRVGGMEGILPAQQKQALLKELCTNRWKNGEAGRNNIQLFFSFLGKLPTKDLHSYIWHSPALWGSSAQFNYIKRQLNWTLQTDKA